MTSIDERPVLTSKTTGQYLDRLEAALGMAIQILPERIEEALQLLDAITTTNAANGGLSVTVPSPVVPAFMIDEIVMSGGFDDVFAEGLEGYGWLLVSNPPTGYFYALTTGGYLVAKRGRDGVFIPVLPVQIYKLDRQALVSELEEFTHL